MSGNVPSDDEKDWIRRNPGLKLKRLLNKYGAEMANDLYDEPEICCPVCIVGQLDGYGDCYKDCGGCCMCDHSKCEDKCDMECHTRLDPVKRCPCVCDHCSERCMSGLGLRCGKHKNCGADCDGGCHGQCYNFSDGYVTFGVVETLLERAKERSPEMFQKYHALLKDIQKEMQELFQG